MNEASQIIHTCYTVSLKDMIEIWVESFHHEDHVVVVWDALTHFEFLKKSGLSLNEAVLYDNKVLIIRLLSCENAMSILNSLPIEEGPFVQVYSMGKFITDNIDK